VVGCLDPLVEDPGVNHESGGWKDPGSGLAPVPGAGEAPAGPASPSTEAPPLDPDGNGGSGAGVPPDLLQPQPPANGGSVPVTPPAVDPEPATTSTPGATDPGADLPPSDGLDTAPNA